MTKSVSSQAIYSPIFTEQSQSVEGPFFYISPGHIIQAQAFGFAEWAARENNALRKVPQAACLEMVLFREGIIPSWETPETRGRCKFIFDLRQYTTDIEAIEEVQLHGCGLSLTACNNMMLLHVPGAYRFVLNDATSVGQVRVYLREFTVDEFPWNSRFLMGEE